jgi:glycosyltransferase involved in cell wall biosynthesis
VLAVPNLSIVIPHFNRADLLAEAIASVRRQTHEEWEIVVVDDGSELAQWQRVSVMADARIFVIRRVDGRKGPSRCRNLGWLAARGQYVVFLDSDDLLAPWCLEQRLRCVQAQPNADLWVFPVLLFSEQPGDSDLQWNLLESPVMDLDRFLQSDPPWHTSSPLWRRKTMLALGGFNEAVCYGDDADLHIRALVKGAQIQKFPNATPDAFVRRGAEARITNTLSPALIESRRVRLEEGTRFLHQAGVGPAQIKLWEGQYFVEAEFLLFNVDNSETAIRRVLADWQRRFRPTPVTRSFVTRYFRLAVACRRKAYLLIRVARRLAMKLLPAQYFPRGGAFQSVRIASGVMDQVHKGLDSQPHDDRESIPF